MKKIFIKYNPYKLETELTVDGKELAQNSKIGEWIVPGTRLQEWVEDLPKELIEEYNDTEFDVVFHGTLMDYEDLTEVFSQAYKRGDLTASLDRIPAKETSDKEILIEEVFEEIQRGPFKELQDPEIINAFEHEKSSEFEVCVVATMSSGKSTLINAMLGSKLMPSKQEACTAIITRIKDVENESNRWQAEVYNKENQLIEACDNLTYENMSRINDDKEVSLIKVNGDIPFVSAEELSLVLIDTPGPNNSRDRGHRTAQNEFLSKSSKSLILYIMEGTFGSDDDEALLRSVAESIKVGGKQSKDRFLFVVNKMDNRREEDGLVSQTLERVKDYLQKQGITNPNLFPAAALPALNIRLLQKGEKLDENTMDETELFIKKLNRTETLHLEEYASLPASIRGKIKDILSEAKDTKNVNTEALIHTGIISIEAMIRQYIQKYAKTAKIKNIVDTFIHKLDAVGCLEKTKAELMKNTEEKDKQVEKISSIKKKMEDAEAAKKFRVAIDDAIIKVNDASKEVIESVVQKYQVIIMEKIDKVRGEELSIDEAEYEVNRLERFASKLDPDFQTELDELISKNLIDMSKMLLEEYQKKLVSLTEELRSTELGNIQIDPLKLIGASEFSSNRFSMKKLIELKEVEDGEEWVENYDKAWYKPWTWFQEKGYYRTKYKEVEFIEASKLAQEFLAPLQERVYENGEGARNHALKESKKLANLFNNEFKRLDDILKSKLDDLERCLDEKDNIEKESIEINNKLEWLENIKTKVESILEI